MNVSVLTTITINIDGDEMELDLAEAKIIYDELGKIFGQKKEVPTIHPLVTPLIGDYVYPDPYWKVYTTGSGARIACTKAAQAAKELAQDQTGKCAFIQ